MVGASRKEVKGWKKSAIRQRRKTDVYSSLLHAAN